MTSFQLNNEVSTKQQVFNQTKSFQPNNEFSTKQ